MNTRNRHWGLHLFGLLLLGECVADYLTESLGRGNRMLVYGIRGALILYVLLYRNAGPAPSRAPSGSLRSLLPAWLVCFVMWITALSVYHMSMNVQTLFEPVRYWYWLSGFLFFSRYGMDPEARGIVAGWGGLLFGLIALQTVSVIGMRMSDSSLLAVNASYMLLAVYPWILLSKHKLYGYAGTAIMAGCALAGLKRGAIVSAALMVVSAAWVVYRTDPKRNRWRAMAQAAVMLAVCAAALAAAFQMRGGALLKRLTPEAGLSGREDIYRHAFEQVQASGPAEVLLGRGPLSTLLESGWYAHNDWLQLTLDYGVIALGLYVLIHLAALRLIAAHIRRRSPLCVALTAAYCLFLVRGITGGYINYPEMIYAMCLFGMAAGPVHAATTGRPVPYPAVRATGMKSGMTA